MKPRQLTNRARAATSPAMDQTMEGIVPGTRGLRRWTLRPMAMMKGSMLAGVATMLSGCISVNAPDKPIVIELNINIKQEVVYRLAADAGNAIKDNPDIF